MDDLTADACQHENPVGAKFCGECGAPLEGCPSCGQRNDPGTKFCRACGQSLGGRLDGPAPMAAARDHPTTTVPAFVASTRYRIERFLGEGAKKRVYLAHDTRLERDVALALIKADGLDDAGLARVRREARAMGRLGDHPHIVTVYDVGEEGAQTYIVSQFMSGGAISDLLDRAELRRLAPDETARFGDQVAAALEHAHARGIVHRDLKPGNVWLTADGTAKLGDFGLAVSVDRSRLTVEGMMVGTVAYMPPEQALGQPPDARSDLYALGAMLYEMVTGRPPFLGDDAVAIISQHINTPPVAPSWHNPQTPRALEALIMRLLAKASEDRPENATAVRQSLAAIAATAVAAPADQPRAEEINPLDRLAGGVFVGREGEMDQLRAGLEDSLSGRGRLLLLVGEPGIGKTRTAEELVTYARLRKAQVLWGRCYEGDGAPAYWPWVQALRAYVSERESERLRAEMGSGAAEIAQVVSEVRARLPDLPQPPGLDPEQARFRLFDSITTFLRNASRAQPLVLVLDDLHWADKPSLLLLQFLARELRGARLLVLGTYRDVEVRRQHPLAEALAELAREQLAERIVLRGLNARDVARFIEITAGLKPPADLVAAVYKETEGNPFFVNEVVRLLVSDGRLQHPEKVKSWSVGIPQSVREVLGRRLDRLSPSCNEILRIASVVGREFSLEILSGVSELGEERLLDALEEAVGARVVVEVPAAVWRYSFAHALVRETLYEELSSTRRLRLHRQIGEVLERVYSAHVEPHLAELAYHFCAAARAGDAAKAIDYAERAATRAVALMAHEEAVRLYEQAVQVLDFQQPPDDQRRCELLLALGQTHWRAGLFPEAKETFLRAAEMARGLGAAEQLAYAALGVGGRLVAFETGIFDPALVALLEEALCSLGDTASPLRARVMARLAVALTFSQDDEERRRELSVQATAMARRGNDTTVLAEVLRFAHFAMWGPDDLDDRLAWAHEYADLARSVGDLEGEIEGRIYRLTHTVEKADIDTAKRELDFVCRLAESSRQPYYCWTATAFRALWALMEGRFRDGEQLAQQALEIGQPHGNQNAIFVYYCAHQLLIRKERGGLEEIVPVLQSFAEQFDRLPGVHAVLALVYADLGRVTESRRELDRLAANGAAALPRDFVWLATMAILADVCADLGDRSRAPELYELLAPYERRNVSVSPVGVCWGVAARPLARLAALTERWELAIQHFDTAIELHTRIGAHPWLAHTQHQYADVLLRRGQPGDRERALGLLNAALHTARELDMPRLLERGLALKLASQGIDASNWATSIDAVAAAVQRDRPDLRGQAGTDGMLTIVFTDVEDSAALLERLGDQRAQGVLRQHNGLIREQVQAHGGFVVKSMGDGFMLGFQSPRAAVLAAIGIQRAFAAGRRNPEGIRVRVGLHVGAVIKEHEDFYGRAVVLAARIAGQAHGGEILVSSAIQQLTSGAGEFNFDQSREVALKGLADAYRLHRVLW